MLSQRYSCDRCRQQKVRCLKSWKLTVAVDGTQLTSCERCTKAETPCVYSLRQKHRRSRGSADATGEVTHTTQELSNASASKDVATSYDLNDLMMSSLDTSMFCMDDWNNDPSIIYNREDDQGAQDDSGISSSVSLPEGKETVTGQLISLSTRALAATRDIEREIHTSPLSVNSPVINEAFETANALVRIINSLASLTVDNAYGSAQLPSPDDHELQLPSEFSTIFLALASHQHVLTLFRAICDSIKRSSGCIFHGTGSQQQTLHGVGSSSAQFIMVLQLIMHLLNRVGRSLGQGNRKTVDQTELTLENREGKERQSIVDSAQAILTIIPQEHSKLIKVIEELQTYIEDGVHF